MNYSLNKAKIKKDDEFYTLYEDIEKELTHYKQYFQGKRIFCNCDDPSFSNFWKFFKDHFESFSLKELSSLYYIEPPKHTLIMDNREREVLYLTIYDGKKEDKYRKRGSGSFMSRESIEVLRASDIVVTNPPFSLFHDFIRLCLEERKDFIVLGSCNAVSTPYFLEAIRDKRVYIGYNHGSFSFKRENGTIVSFGNICWYSSFPVPYPEKLKLIKTYKGHEEDYPFYKTCPDTIEVSSLKNIPCDYFGKMGVPLSYLNVYNPDQFEIIISGEKAPVVPFGKRMITRYRKQGGDGHYTASTYKLAYMDKEGRVQIPYQRIIIRRNPNDK